MKIDDAELRAGEWHASPAAEVTSERRARSGGWQGPVMIFVLGTCCLLPIFLVALIDYVAAYNLGWPVPRWVTVVALSVGGVAVALWWSARSQARARRGHPSESSE